MIKYIINKIFDEYYHNRNKSVYCIDNLIRKYSMKYFCIERTYGIVKSTELIFRFNRYSKRNYIKKLLRNHEYFYLNKDENINKITDYILEPKQKNYKKYIEHLYLDKYFDRMVNILDIEILNNSSQ